MPQDDSNRDAVPQDVLDDDDVPQDACNPFLGGGVEEFKEEPLSKHDSQLNLKLTEGPFRFIPNPPNINKNTPTVTFTNLEPKADIMSFMRFALPQKLPDRLNISEGVPVIDS